MLDDGSLALTTAPYGSWRSPITADLIVGDTVALPEAWLDGDDVYWCEGRPKEGGRFVVVKYGVHGPAKDVTPPSFNARTRVHEYGGAAALVREGTVYFANFADQKLYRQSLGESPQAIGQTAQCRYADAVFDGANPRAQERVGRITLGAPLSLFLPTGLNSNPRIASRDRKNPLEQGPANESNVVESFAQRANSSLS